MAKGDTKTNQYLDIAANGTRADLPTDTCCETRSQTLIREVAERIMDVEDEVEELKNNPDVADIVPTYAALQQYDTSTLTDKALIRVLADETHDGQSTYYRYSTSTQQFTYVGAAGDYYTKAQTDAALALKADKATTYTKTEVDTALDLKADKATTYTKTEVDTALAGKQNTLTFDSTPTASSTNPVTSEGIKAYVDALPVSGATVLTSADYNWPVNNPNCVALWLLEPGYYVGPSDSTVSVRPTSSYSGGMGNGFPCSALVIHKAIDNNNRGALVWFSNSPNDTRLISAIDVNGSNWSARKLDTSVTDSLTSTSATSALSANQGKVLKGLIDSIAIRGAGAPTTSTIGEVGQLYEDGTNGALYQLKSIDITVTPNTYNWEQVGAGGGGVTELTSANYNYPTNNPDGLAPWLLEPGMYYIKANPVSPIRLYNSSSSSLSFAQNESLIINKTTVSGDPMTNVISYTNSGNIWSVDYDASGTRKKEGQIITSNSIVSSTGTSTASVMSQNATTSMVYADPLYRRNIKLGASASIGNGVDNAVAIGSSAKANNGQATAVGTNSTASGNSSTAVGRGAIASALGSVALGTYSSSTVQGQVDVGTTVADYGYNNSNYRLLTGLYDPQSDHDAATKGYVDGLISALEARIAALEGN